jgi:RimJ/RimL family protein N-acetyltransferase
MATFALVKTANGFAGLRDITAADVPAIVDYWILAPDEHLTSMGVDRQRIGTQEDIYRRFANAIRTGDARQSNTALGITLDDRLVGYTLLNRYSDDVNYSHWHIIEPNLRAKGLSSALYPHRMNWRQCRS